MRAISVLVVALMAASASASFDFRGQVPPELSVGGWCNLPEGTPRPKLAELRGQVVLIHYWHSTCTPCLGKLAKLRELYESLAGEGLVILALSQQNKPTVENQFEKQKIPCACAYDDKSAYGVEGPDKHDNKWHAADNAGRPESYLISIDGAVAWQGDLAELTAATVRIELDRARPLPAVEWEKSIGKIAKEVEQGKFGKAQKTLTKLAEKEKDPAVAAQIQTLLDFIAAKAADKKALADMYAGYERYLRATEVLRELVSEFEDTTWAEEADAQLDTWKKDDAIQILIETEKLFFAAKQLKRERKYADAGQVFAEVVKKAPESVMAEEAKREIAWIENKLNPHH